MIYNKGASGSDSGQRSAAKAKAHCAELGSCRVV